MRKLKKEDIVLLPVDEVKPYPNNPRKNDGAVQAVADSIEKFGFRGAILVDEKKEIINGHTRWKAAKKLGLDKVPCIICDDLSEQEKKAFRIVDNRTNEFAEWDDEKLEAEWRELTEVDLGLWGFEFPQDDGEQPQAKEDEVSEDIPRRAKRGDLWALGDHRLICGDTTDKATLDRLMNDDKAAMVFTDPPYGVAIGDKNKAINAVEAGRGRRIQENIEGDAISEDELYELLKKAFVNIREHTREDACYYVTSPQGGSLGLMMMMMMKDAGLPVRHVLMWNKNNATFSLGRLDYDYKHEPIFYTWTAKHNNYRRGKFRTTVWDVDKPLSSRLHPTMKPIALIANAVLDASKEGEIVLDGFGGSGSTLIACEQLKRRAYLCELDEHYADVIIKRWEDLTGRQAVKIE